MNCSDWFFSANWGKWGVWDGIWTNGNHNNNNVIDSVQKEKQTHGGAATIEDWKSESVHTKSDFVVTKRQQRRRRWRRQKQTNVVLARQSAQRLARVQQHQGYVVYLLLSHWRHAHTQTQRANSESETMVNVKKWTGKQFNLCLQHIKQNLKSKPFLVTQAKRWQSQHTSRAIGFYVLLTLRCVCRVCVSGGGQVASSDFSHNEEQTEKPNCMLCAFQSKQNSSSKSKQTANTRQLFTE